MKNKFILSIIFLSTTCTLFSAWYDIPIRHSALLSKSADSQEIDDEKIIGEKELTAKLQQLFHECKGSIFWNKYSSRMRKLICRGADPNIRGNGGIWLLSAACRYDDIEFVKACASRVVLPKFIVTQCESVLTLKLLWKLGANFNNQDRLGRLALYYNVAGNCSAEIIELLCRYTEPLYKDGVETPLHCLCWCLRPSDFAKKTELLLWWSLSQLDARNDKGQTPIDYLRKYNKTCLIPLFNEISKNMKRIQGIRLKLEKEISKDIEQSIQEFVPLYSLAKLICDYSGLRYLSLQNFMKKEELKAEQENLMLTQATPAFSLDCAQEEAKQEYPALAEVVPAPLQDYIAQEELRQEYSMLAETVPASKRRKSRRSNVCDKISNELCSKFSSCCIS